MNDSVQVSDVGLIGSTNVGIHDSFLDGLLVCSSIFTALTNVVEECASGVSLLSVYELFSCHSSIFLVKVMSNVFHLLVMCVIFSDGIVVGILELEVEVVRLSALLFPDYFGKTNIVVLILIFVSLRGSLTVDLHGDGAVDVGITHQISKGHVTLVGSHGVVGNGAFNADNTDAYFPEHFSCILNVLPDGHLFLFLEDGVN